MVGAKVLVEYSDNSQLFDLAMAVLAMNKALDRSVDPMGSRRTSRLGASVWELGGFALALVVEIVLGRNPISH